MNETTGRIVQIIPAPAGMETYHRGNEKQKQDGPIVRRVVCLALVEHPDGSCTVEPMVNKGFDFGLVNPDGSLGIKWD